MGTGVTETTHPVYNVNSIFVNPHWNYKIENAIELKV